MYRNNETEHEDMYIDEEIEETGEPPAHPTIRKHHDE
jgi:hypothetical protein